MTTDWKILEEIWAGVPDVERKKLLSLKYKPTEPIQIYALAQTLLKIQDIVEHCRKEEYRSRYGVYPDAPSEREWNQIIDAEKSHA